MHNRLLITFNQLKAEIKDQADNSEEARRYAIHYLEEEGFCDQRKFCYGPADWFVIGGRWSGELLLSHLDEEKLEQFYKEPLVLHISQRSSDEEKEQVWSMFGQYFPEFPSCCAGDWVGDWVAEILSGNNIELPYCRDSYRVEGYVDDAMPVDEAIYQRLLKEYEGKYESDEYKFIDLDGDIVDIEFIGNKWIVVVDYHC